MPDLSRKYKICRYPLRVRFARSSESLMGLLVLVVSRPLAVPLRTTARCQSSKTACACLYRYAANSHKRTKPDMNVRTLSIETGLCTMRTFNVPH